MEGEAPPRSRGPADARVAPVLEFDELPSAAELRRALRPSRPRQRLAVEPPPPVVPAARAAIGLIHLYQRHLSARLGRTCLLEPSCSRYAELAIAHQGLLRGVVATWRRLRRCRPENEGQIDYPEGAVLCHTKSSPSDASSTTSREPS